MNKKKLSENNILNAVVLSTFFAIFISIIIYCGFIGQSRDYSNYQDIIGTLVAKGCRYSDGSYIVSSIEFGFQEEVCFLSNILKQTDLIYSAQIFISIFLKSIFFLIIALTQVKVNRKSINSFLPFLMGFIIYFLRYFPIHDFTQIRASISIGFFLISCAFLKLNLPTDIEPENLEKNRIVNLVSLFLCISKQKRLRIIGSVVFFAISFSFHHSVVVVLPFLLMSNHIRSRRQFIVFMSLSFLTCIIFSNSLFYFITNNVDYVTDQKKYFDNDEHNPFSISRILDLLSVIVSFRIINFRLPLQVFFLSLFSFSIVMFYSISFAGLPNIYAYRLTELLSVFNVFLVTSLETKREIIFIAPIILMASLKVFSHYINEYYFIFP